MQKSQSKPGDYEKVKEQVADVLEKEGYDDGSMGPILVRLAWHASGTFDKNAENKGGSDGATMRFEPESKHGSNAGLEVARDHLEQVKKANPWISYADLWTLAGYVFIKKKKIVKWYDAIHIMSVGYYFFRFVRRLIFFRYVRRPVVGVRDQGLVLLYCYNWFYYLTYGFILYYILSCLLKYIPKAVEASVANILIWLISEYL